MRKGRKELEKHPLNFDTPSIPARHGTHRVVLSITEIVLQWTQKVLSAPTGLQF